MKQQFVKKARVKQIGFWGENFSMVRWSHLWKPIKAISVEPAYFMFALSQGLYLIVSSELYISKVSLNPLVHLTNLRGDVSFFSIRSVK